MTKKLLHVFALVIISGTSYAQEGDVRIEMLKKEVLLLKSEVNNIQLNLKAGEKRFKKGILVSTIGYSVTIAGGLMLGRKQDELGKGLLIAGGVTGITGTILMVDAIKFFGRAGQK